MIYNGFIVDKNGRANKCPRCLNEQINGGEYCKICGVTIVNKCTGTDYNGFPECEEIAEGNARYCTKCGEKTTFFNAGLLKAWEVELEEKSKDEVVKQPISDPFSNNTPVDISDDDLPF